MKLVKINCPRCSKEVLSLDKPTTYAGKLAMKLRGICEECFTEEERVELDQIYRSLPYIPLNENALLEEDWESIYKTAHQKLVDGGIDPKKLGLREPSK